MVWIVYLIEDGLVWADEAPLEHLLLTIRILDWVADMEYLAFVRYISIITVGSSFTGKLVHYIVPKY